MSAEGIKIFAGIMDQMQQARHTLIAIACGEAGSQAMATPDGKQDLRLAHLLDEAKDAVKDKFCQITSE